MKTASSLISIALLSAVTFVAQASSSEPAPQGATEVDHSVRTTVTTDASPTNPNNPLTDPKTAVAEVQALADAQKFVAAEKKAREFLGRDASVAQLHNLLGFCLRKQGKYQLSMASYREALKIDPNFAQAKEYLAISYLNTKEIKPALELYKDLQKTNPELAKMVAIEAKRLKITLK